MISNPTIDVLMNHRSIRKYTDEVPNEEIIETIVKAGQQAAFAGQLGSLILSRDKTRHPFSAPLYFIICVDIHRMRKVMEKRNWQMISSDAAMLMFGVQDACYLAQNLVIAAESLGLGTCYLGFVPFNADKLIEKYKLPPKVFPLVGISVGYPAENPPVRPRYPLDFACYDGVYLEFSDEQIEKAMQVMDEGYLGQDYYQNGKLIIKLENDREETFDGKTYSWTEHISRKWGQWLQDPMEMKEILKKYGFEI
ncbi:MAG: nitroreductase family protein [Candidatus Cloacimonadales bacterium]|nr:nitroreductase family protein [Candidatus Cloacimonadales bacterium]